MKQKFILWIDDMQSWTDIVIENINLLALERGMQLIIKPQLNGENLEQILMLYPFDLIVMDYQMSPFNGDKYIKDIRFEPHLDGIPILFYSQDPDINLKELISDTINVHITNRKLVEDRIMDFIFPSKVVS